MFKKILLPLDGSALAERAIDPVEMIASGTGAEVLLIRIVTAPLGTAPEAGQEEESQAFLEGATKAKAYLEKVAARLAGKSVKSRILIASGEPYTSKRSAPWRPWPGRVSRPAASCGPSTSA